MIFGVIATLLLYRGARSIPGLPLRQELGPFASRLIAAFSGLSRSQRPSRDHLHPGPAGRHLGFFVFVLYSKHMHIFVSEPNVCSPGQGPRFALQHARSGSGEDG